MDSIIKQLNELQNIKPRRDWVESQRELLLSQITKQTAAKPQSFLVNSWFLAKSLLPGGFMRFVARPVGVLTMIALFVFSSGMLGVNASRRSLPGDFLYPVKRSSEKMKVGMTVKEEKKAVLHLRLAEERVKEIETLTRDEKQPKQKQAKIKIAVSGLKEEMNEAKKTLDKVKEEPKKTQKVIEVAKQVDNMAAALSEKIGQKKAETSDKEIVKSLDAAVQASDAASVNAVSVIVEKHENGEAELSQEEIKQTIEKIDNKIQKAQQQVNVALEEVKEASKTVENIAVVEAAAAANNQTANAAADPNNAGSPGNSAVEQGASYKLQEIKTKPEEAGQKLSEAKTLLNHGDLSSAIEMVKQSAEITEEVKQGVETINNALENKK